MQRLARKASLRVLVEAYRRAGIKPPSPKRRPDARPQADGVPVSPRTPPSLSGGAAAALTFDDA